MSWYRKHFDVPAEWKGKAIWLYFEGVFRFAYTYINGEFIGRHGSGYTSFSIRLDNATNMTYGEGSVGWAFGAAYTGGCCRGDVGRSASKVPFPLPLP